MKKMNPETSRFKVEFLGMARIVRIPVFERAKGGTIV
jgi:hypothetical protein